MNFDQFEYATHPIAPIKMGAILLSGYAFKSQDFGEIGFPVIKIRNIQSGRATCTNSQCISNEFITNNLEKYLLQNGDVLIAMTGQGSVGRVGRLECKSHERPVMNQRVGKFITDEISLNKDYLYYVISSKLYEEQLFSMGSGSGQPNLSPSMILSLKIPFPPYTEQVAIANTLNDLDVRVTLLRETNATLEAIAKALFKSWFVDFDPVRAKMEGRAPEGMDETTAALFPDSFEESELGLVPRGWRAVKFEDFITRLTVGQKYDQKSAQTEGSIPILDQGKSGVIGFHDEQPSVLASLDEPVVVFANHTCNMRLITFPFSAIQNVLPFKGKKVDTVWAYYATQGRVKFSEYKGHWPDFTIEKCALPNELITVKFRGVVDSLIRRIRNNERMAKSLEDLRGTLLPRLISGQLRLPDNMAALGAA